MVAENTIASIGILNPYQDTTAIEARSCGLQYARHAGGTLFPFHAWLSDADLAATKMESQTLSGTVGHLEKIGVAEAIRDHLKQAGWAPPA